MKKHCCQKFLMIFGCTVLSTLIVTPVLASCSLLPRPQEQDKPNQPEGQTPDVQPPGSGTEGQPNPPSGGNGNPDSGNNGIAFNPWGHSQPNPNYKNDPANSFLISPNGQTPGAGYHPSPGVPQNAQLESWHFTNQQQVINSKKSFAITVGSTHRGTAWILDYKIPDGVNETNGSFQYDDTNYPTTWYIASNAHVLDDFVDGLPGEEGILYPNAAKDHVGNPVERTTNVSLQFPKNPAIGPVFNILESAPLRTNEKYNVEGGRIEILNETNAKMKRVYVGNDFLTTSPNEFNTSARFASGMQEYADFAVLEVQFQDHVVTFRNTSTNVTQTKTLATAQQYAKYATQNYANLPADQKFVYKKTDLLNDRPALTGGLNIVGYPDVGNGNRALFVNRPKGDKTTDASALSTSPNYSTFTKEEYGIDGIMDGIIGMGGWFGYQYQPTQETHATWGLIYPSDYGSLDKGSSGSLVTDQAGISWGIHFAGDNTASTGMAQAFYSKGYNYKGKYGKYDLPAYDLISGEPESKKFPLQKTSYRHNLTKLYKANYRTNLFPKGIHDASYK